jgi:hypothetical protein
MKQLFFLSAFIGLTVITSAQENRLASFGLKGGANIYTIKGDDFKEEGFKNQVGFHAGAFYQFPVAELFSIQPEVLYSGEGIRYKDEDLTADIHFKYINVPVMFQFVTPSGLFAETGPQVSFLLSGESKYKETGGDKYEEDIKEDMKSTSFSWGVGAGYMIKNIGLGARYNFGLSNLPDDKEDGKGKSNGLQISLIWKFAK